MVQENGRLPTRKKDENGRLPKTKNFSKKLWGDGFGKAKPVR
jgi:hypothetical protein